MGGRLKPASSMPDDAGAAPVPPVGELAAIPALASSLLARPASKRALDESSGLLFAKGTASTSRWRSYDHKDVFEPAQRAVAPPSDADLAGAWLKYDGAVAPAATVSEEELPTSWYKYETKPLASLLETTGRPRSKAPIYLAETAPPALDQPAQPETPPAAKALDAAEPQAHPQPSEPVAVAETPAVPAEPPAPEMVRALEPVPASEAEPASAPAAEAIEAAPEAPPPAPPSAPEAFPASSAEPPDEAEIRTAELPAPSLDPVDAPQALEPSDDLPTQAPPPPMMEAEPAPVTPMEEPPVLVAHAELAPVTPVPSEALARSEAPGEPIPAESPSTEAVGALSPEADLPPPTIDAPAVEALAPPAPSEELPRSEEPIQPVEPIPAEPPSVMIPKFVGELRNLNHTSFIKLVARVSLKFASEFQGRDTSLEAEDVLNPEADLPAATIDPPAVEALETAPPPSWRSEPEIPSSAQVLTAGWTDAPDTQSAEPATPPVAPSAEVVAAQAEPAPTHGDASIEPEVLAPAIAEHPPQEPALELGVETEAAAPAPEATAEAAPSLDPSDERELSQMAVSAIKSRGPANKAMLAQLAELLERALSAKRSARDAEPPLASEPEASASPSRETERSADAVASEPWLPSQPETASLELPTPPEATEPAAPEILLPAVPAAEAAIPREDTVEAELAPALPLEAEPESDAALPPESASSRAHDAPPSVPAEVLSEKPDLIDKAVPEAPSAEDPIPIAAGAVESATERVKEPEPEHAASIEAAPVLENLGAAPAAEGFAEEPVDVAAASIEDEKSPQEALADDLAGMIHEVLSTRKFATTALKPTRYSSVAPSAQASEEPEPAELEDAGEVAAEELPHPATIRPRLSRMERAVAFACAGMMIVVGYFAISLWRNDSVSAQAPVVLAAPASKVSGASARGVSRDFGAAASAQRSNSSSLELGQ
jgi:hypothetical protein